MTVRIKKLWVSHAGHKFVYHGAPQVFAKMLYCRICNTQDK